MTINLRVLYLKIYHMAKKVTLLGGSCVCTNHRYVDAFLDYANCGFVSLTLGLFEDSIRSFVISM